MQKNPEKSLRLKVWFIISLALIPSFAAIGWSLIQFKTLTDLIDELKAPNENERLITNTLQNFISAENHIQSYIITGNRVSEKTYEVLIKKTREGIERLKEINENDSSRLVRIDSLSLLFERKIDYLHRFLQLKKKRQAIAFTQLARKRIEAYTSDSTLQEKKIYTRTEVTEGLLPTETTEVVTRKDTSKGFWNSLKRVFGNSYRLDTLKKLDYDYYVFENVTRDTATITSYHRDSVLMQVKEILEKTEGQEQRWQQNLTKRELDMIMQDQLFMEEIRSIIDELDRNERALTAQKRNEAFMLAQDSTRTIIAGGIIGFVISCVLLLLIMKDITRASYFRTQLELAKSKAEKLANMKGSFLANMSHEIRTPLNSILGFTRLLKTTRLTNDQQQYMNAVSGSSSYLSGLVNDILDYSKIESGKLTLVNAPFSTQKLFNEIHDMFSLSIKNKGLTFEWNIAKKIPEQLIGDAFRIRQIISNLLTNAIKFTDTGKISVCFEGDWFKELFYLKIIVTDTGIGIAKDKLVTIFEAFNQEDPETVNNYGGTGLGLAICHRLIQFMNGKIQVDSKKNKGSSFRVIIPSQKVSEHVVENSLSKHKEADLQLINAHIVLVEDDSLNALLLKTLLTRKRANVTVFSSPVEAVEYICKNIAGIDLLFTDLKMPEMSGQELILNCRNRGFKGPIVAITAHMQHISSSEKDAMGVQGVCMKPYREEEIDHWLSTLLPLNKYEWKIREMATFPKQSNGVPVDLTDLKKFARDDNEVLQEFTSELIINNEKQIEQFKQLLDNESWRPLMELAHRMIPTYDHTRQYHISEQLKTIELFIKTNNFKRVVEMSQEIVYGLEEALIKFKSVNDQLHTS
ncbi:MAG: ATP-binding protein [Bacteroidota bacterium]